MPNWCHNLLTVRGDPAEIAAFAAKALPPRAAARREYEEEDAAQQTPFEEWFREHQRRQPLSFESFAPSPEDDDDLGDAWGGWAVRHWGTKWDAYFEPEAILGYDGANPEASIAANGLVATEEVLIYKFLTAWSQPEEAVAAMAEQHPQLDFVLRYAEYGSDSGGESRYAHGELVEQVELGTDQVFAPEERWF